MLLAIVQAVFPFTAGFMQVALALILLEVPLRLVKNLRAAPLWLRIGPIGRGLKLGGQAVLIVFPLFIGGFHLVYTAILDRPVDWDVKHLARWSEDLEYAPEVACGRPVTSVWTQEGTLWLTAPADTALEVRLERPAGVEAKLLSCPKGGAPLPQVGRAIKPRDGAYRPPPGAGILFHLGDATGFELRVAGADGPIPRDAIVLGHNRVEADDDGLVEGSRSYLWLLTFVLIHLGLVAYPEEYFFRGYLMPRLDQRFGTPYTIFGVAVGKGLVISALMFALLHPILIPGPHRLLVFFPALLFGWLAAKQRELGAAIFVHAMSNVLLAVVSRMYG